MFDRYFLHKFNVILNLRKSVVQYNVAISLSLGGWPFSLIFVFQGQAVYCKFGNFGDNFIFTNSVKSHICVVKNRN